MTQETDSESGSDWKKFMKKHWAIAAVITLAGILAVVGAVYVLVWFTGQAQNSGLVPSSLGLWSMGNAVMYILHAIFWELLLIGIPTLIGAVLGWQWWRRLPEEEKREYHLSSKHSRSKGAGGAISPLLFAAFALKVYIDGNWNSAISTYTVDYVLGSMISILIWIVAIFAIPAAIGLIWWFRHESKKN